jgi:WD40 repeat protein
MASMLAGETLVYRHGRHVSLTAAVALGDGSVNWIADDGAVQTSTVHGGAILSACRYPDGKSVVTGGDDGRVVRVAQGGETVELGRFERKWIEHLVASPASGLIVAGIGREAVAWTKGAPAASHRFAVASTIGGLALDGKGKRLAVAHYGGATLFYGTNASSGRIELNWVGSHLACTMSADGHYLLTALQETGLHGWQLPEMRDMRMSGYASKTRSFAWDRRGKWLATSGDAAAILWPFEGKTGPIGKAPLMLAERKGQVVSRVAFHPRDDVLAVGYGDGTVLLARPADGETLLIDEGGGYITTLAWNDSGTRLGWGDEDGRIGILDMEARA